MMYVRFHNVQIDIEAETAKDAYNKLCELLESSPEFVTDTFQVWNDDTEKWEIDTGTDELFPEDEEATLS